MMSEVAINAYRPFSLPHFSAKRSFRHSMASMRLRATDRNASRQPMTGAQNDDYPG